MPQRCAVPVEFIVTEGGKPDAQQVADYLNNAIKGWQDAGWRFCHLEGVVAVKPVKAFGVTATIAPVQTYVAILEKD
jgi:hypothetical protein